MFPKDFLTNYLDYAVGGNEVPEIYHIWSGMAALSICAGRRFWLRFNDDYILYPNLNILLVGSAGGRKTSAMTVARAVIRAVGGIPQCASIMTKEAIAKEMTPAGFEGRKSFIDPGTKRMKVFTEYAIFANEWVHFISVNPKGMIEFMIETWEQEVYAVGTKNMGNDLIIGPCLPLLGCMTPATSTAQMKADIINGGFARRCIFVYANEDGVEPVARPFKTEAQEKAKLAAINQGKIIAGSDKFCGEFTWGEGTGEWYDKWYVKHWYKIKQNTNPWTQSYYKSRHDLLLKVALLLGISQQEEMKLTIKNLVRADEMLAETEKHLDKIFEDAGRNEQSVVANQIMEQLRNHPNGITRKRLQREMFGQANSQEFASIIEHLRQTDQIVSCKDPNGPEMFLTKENYDKQK